MNLYVYTDESGVFDHIHNDYFVFGGVIYLSKQERDIATRKYTHVENTIRRHYKMSCELKANHIFNKDKGKIFRSLNNTIKFGAVVSQKRVQKHIFDNKKSKQRYLDYVYKITLKRTLENLHRKDIIQLDNIDNLYIFCDEHTTATDGIYELRECILQELKYGTFNHNYNIFFEPICSNIKDIQLKFRDSKHTTLIRAADIVANKIFYHAKHNNIHEIKRKIFIVQFP